MLRGIYSSAAGMIMEMDKVSMHAENIANAQTAGFKRREMSSVPFKEIMVKVVNDQGDYNHGDIKLGGRIIKSLSLPVGTGSGAGFMDIDSMQGSLKPTGNPMDLAISGDGYFVMERTNPVTGKSEEYTTKNGKFSMDSQGYVVNPEGHFLLGQAGRIRIDNTPTDDKIKSLSERIVVKDNGKIFDGESFIDTLRVKTDTNQMLYVEQLKMAVPIQADAQVTAGGKFASNKRKADGSLVEINIEQGFLEGSNVQIISEMVGLIHASKNYESGHKLIMSEDKILDKSINELGRTG